MIVGVVPIGAGVVPVNHQFFDATSVADGVNQYVNGYTPPRNPADFLGFDTGWTRVQTPSPGKRWGYDRTGLALVEIDLAFPDDYGDTIYCPHSGVAIQNLPRASTAESAVVISYLNAASDLTIGRDVNTDTINGVASDRVNLPEGLYVAIPSSLTNWELYGPLGDLNDGINAWDSTGGQVFTGTITVLMDSNRLSDSGLFTLNAGTGEITVNRAIEWAEVSYQVSLDATTNTRVSAAHWVELNGVEIVGSSAYSYHRTATSGEDTGACSVQLALAQGDVLRVRSQRLTASGTVVTIAQGSRLNVKALK